MAAWTLSPRGRPVDSPTGRAARIPAPVHLHLPPAQEEQSFVLEWELEPDRAAGEGGVVRGRGL
ncbi:MAG: hypothetical protein ACRD12_16985 [Acidimicrobiales bacterium]